MRGPHALTEAELIAILLRVGAEGKNAVELGRRAANPTPREKTFIKSTRQAAEYFSGRLRGLPTNTSAWPISIGRDGCWTTR